MQRVLRVHEVERGVGEGEALGICDGEGESGLFAPGTPTTPRRRRPPRPVDAGACDTAVTAAAVEERFVAAKRVPELVDATEPVAELVRRTRPQLRRVNEALSCMLPRPIAHTGGPDARTTTRRDPPRPRLQQDLERP